MLTHIKATIAGPVLEVKIYEKPIKYGLEDTNKKARERREYVKTKDTSRRVGDFRTKRRIRQLIYANAHKYLDGRGRAHTPIFITFTFADNITSPKEANKYFTKFLKRLNYALTGSKQATLKYLTVIEFQKRGAVHYHSVFFNLPFINGNVHEFIAKAWSHGFIKINAINDLQHLANYVAKYLTKSERDERLDQKKYFFTSKYLYQPVEIYDNNKIGFILQYLPSSAEKVEVDYKNYRGENINYIRYKLKENEDFKKYFSLII